MAGDVSKVSLPKGLFQQPLLHLRPRAPRRLQRGCLQLGPKPAVRDGATPHLSPPSLPVPLARGSRRGNGCQVRRRCRPGKVHDRTSVSGCPRGPPPQPPPPPQPQPTSRSSGPCAAATSANLPCVIASSGRRWEGAGEEAEDWGARRPRTRASLPQAFAGCAGAETPPGPGGGVRVPAPPLPPHLWSRRVIPRSGAPPAESSG